MFSRHPLNPLITPAQVRPSRPDFEAIGTFNAGATVLNGETLLLVRVAERPHEQHEDWVFCPYMDENGEIDLLEVRRDDPDYDTGDGRFVRNRHTGSLRLTSISHLRLARSTDGVHFAVGDEPWLQPETTYERFGVEDARITRMNGTFYVNYSAVSEHGIATGLVETSDFRSSQRMGIVFPPSNRDVAIFPRMVNGLHHCYHRPMPGEFGKYSMWIASSPDLVHWGDHRLVLQGNAGGWDSGRVGGGAPPIDTEHGWLSVYHAADRQHRYCLGAFLAAHDQPGRVLHRSLTPLMEPEAPYETSGFFPHVVFTCGITVVNEVLRLYYGAADESIGLAEAPLASLLAYLLKH